MMKHFVKESKLRFRHRDKWKRFWRSLGDLAGTKIFSRGFSLIWHLTFITKIYLLH